MLKLSENFQINRVPTQVAENYKETINYLKNGEYETEINEINLSESDNVFMSTVSNFQKEIQRKQVNFFVKIQKNFFQKLAEFILQKEQKLIDHLQKKEEIKKKLETKSVEFQKKIVK